MKNNDRTLYLSSIEIQDSVEKYNILGARVNCLTPSQAVDLFLKALNERGDLIQPCVRKICSDISNGPTKTHWRLVTGLIAEFHTLSPRKKQTVGSFLSRLHYSAPKTMRQEIEHAFSRSTYKSLRKRFYKMISQEELRVHQKLLIHLWEQYHDVECAWLVVKKGPPRYLKNHRAQFIDVLPERWRIARLYLRMVPVYPDLAEELRSIDEISYCYVCAKCRRRISLKTAIEIFERNIADERLGLLIWSFGQLGMWSTLDHITANLDRIEKARLERISTQFKLQVPE